MLFTREINGRLCKPIFRRFKTVNGVRIYPKKAKAFVFWIPIDEEHKAAA